MIFNEGLSCLLGDLAGPIAGVFQAMDWAEEEIAAARDRHFPEHRDLIYHAFGIMLPTPSMELMGTEFVYRSHVRELLDRLVAGGDTREPTNAEVAIVCSDMSQVAPMRPAGVLVYMRAWLAAFPDHRDLFKEQVGSYEVVAQQDADTLEADMRRNLRQPDRTVGEINCSGTHHGETVNCRFAEVAAAA